MRSENIRARLAEQQAAVVRSMSGGHMSTERKVHDGSAATDGFLAVLK